MPEYEFQNSSAEYFLLRAQSNGEVHSDRGSFYRYDSVVCIGETRWILIQVHSSNFVSIDEYASQDRFETVWEDLVSEIENSYSDVIR